jgi:hypothetical protein
MSATFFTRMAKNGGRLINYLQFLRIGSHTNVVFCDYGYLSKQSACWLPAFAATADMVMRSLR